MGDEMQPTDERMERWPRESDCLFSTSAWADDAPVVTDRDERLYRMPMGYKRSGDLLVEQAVVNAWDRRNVIYAALFCYRQSIELYLKRLVLEFERKDQPTKLSHDLSKLWERFAAIAEERGIGEGSGLSAVASLIREMHNADQISDGFRFPTDKRGNEFTFSQGIDLLNLREVMQGLENFFECADIHLSQEAG
ncbi:MAG: hypothetical protein REI94_07070 [Moraxellaceae bacterium]|nr:hypothetical protein [Moraxellaceae bacterium]